MKHYRNAALGLALALGAALAPVHAQGTTMSQDQIDARYDAAKNATPAAATPRSLLETGARRQGRGRGAGQGRQAEGRGQPRRGQGAPGRGLRRGQEEVRGHVRRRQDACLAEAKTRYGK